VEIKLEERIQWFIDNWDLTRFFADKSIGRVFFAVGYSEFHHRWESGYRDEGNEDYNEPLWCGPFGVGLTLEETVEDAYEKYSKIAEDFYGIINSLKKPTQFRTNGKYRRVTIGSSGVNIENLIYINNSGNDHKFWRPDGNMLHLRKESYWWASIFELAE